MRWKFPFPEVLSKRAFRYLLHRYFGQYVQNLSQDQLSYNWDENMGKVDNVFLKVESLNEQSEKYNFPFEFLDVHINSVSMTVPWKSLLAENSLIEVSGVTIVVQLKQRCENVSMFDSMWGSMSSSLQLAEECLHSDVENEPQIDVSQVSNGLEICARTIETVIAKVKAKVTDVTIRIEGLLENSATGVSLEFHIDSIDYYDEAGADDIVQNSNSPEKNTYEPLAYSVKKFVIEGVSLYTNQFPAKSRHFHCHDIGHMNQGTEILTPGSPEMPPTHSEMSNKNIENQEDPKLDTDPVIISRFMGKQEIRLKIKQNESVVGPKLDWEVNLGALNLFLSPHQVHLLLELARGLTGPNASKNSSNKPHAGTMNRPMREADFALVEQELQRQQERPEVPSQSLQNHRGWSSQSLDDSDEEFHLMPNESPALTPQMPDLDSSCSSIGSESRSPFYGNSQCSSSGDHKSTRSRASSVHALLQDPLSESGQLRATCSSICVIVLHEDVVSQTVNNCEPSTKASPKTAVSLKVRAEKYFEDLTALVMSGIDFRSFSDMREPLSLLCQSNHLRVMACALTLEGNEKSSSSQRVFSISMSAADLEILECLFTVTSSKNVANLERHYTELLVSKKNELKRNENKILEWNEPCVKLKYQHLECTSRPRTLKYPANKLTIQLGPFKSEVDLSIIDRVHCLLNPHPMFFKKDKSQDSLFSWRAEDDSCSRFSQKTEINIKSPFIVINFRFPKPDLRPLHDMGRTPWWQQNLQKEVLVMELSDASFSTTLDSEHTEKKIEIQCRDFHGLFAESSTSKPVSFLRVSVDPDADQSAQDNGFDWPRLVIHTVPYSPPSVFDTEMPSDAGDIFPVSWTDTLLSKFDKEPSPFSNAVFCGNKPFSNEASSDDDGKQGFCENNEIVMPAEKEKIHDFIDKTVNKSQCILEFNLPTANLILPDKHFFEVLYNRLVNDLVLWEPTSLPPTHSVDTKSFRVHIPVLDDLSCQSLKECESFQTFQSCVAEITDSDEDDDGGAYCSFNEYTYKQKFKQKKSQVQSSLTKLSVTLNIKKGVAVIHSPLRDSAQNVLPGRCGKLLLQVEDCTFFAASKYNGSPNESYICLVSNKGTLYHNGSTVFPREFSDVQPPTNIVDNLRPIIYRSEDGIPLKAGLSVGAGGDSLDMLSVSVHMAYDVKQQIKTFKVALGLKGTTLRHYMSISSESWLTQLMEFMSVTDYPVSGYIPPAVVTELHLHLDHCAVDYRPIYLPFRTVITTENFNLSSNITASTSTLLLRTISEELCLFLSNNTTASSIELKKNFVCVVQTGLIDVSLRVVSDKSQINPKIELCASNDIIHIRTCVDSCKALQSLITYLASDGDFTTQPSCLKEKVPKPTAEPIRNEAPQAETPPKDVHSLIEEAMRECPCTVSDSSPPAETEHEGFMKFTDINLNIADEEFCILDDDPGVGLMPKNGEPEIRLLCSEPVQPTRNHFVVPSSKSDLLRAPKHFPSPLFCYSLREMSIVWHIFGGNDFKDQKSAKKKKVKISNTYTSDRVNVGKTTEEHDSIVNVEKNVVSFCKVTAERKSLDNRSVRYMFEDCTIESPKTDYYESSWKERGGVRRNREVLMEFHLNKVRFQHEVYPEDSEHASRDVLLIHDIEIRDRLAASEINKFLYQYSCEAMPRQSNAHMLVIKALHTRPDPKQQSEECSLHISCKPLRLNIDQDALMFLYSFFVEVCEMTAADKSSPVQRESNPPGTADYTEPGETLICITPNSAASRPVNPPCLTFFRSFSFAPEVLIRLDYHGKRLIMEQGALQGILMGLAQLNCSELRLKRLSYRHGLLGRDKLVNYAFNEWYQDIKKNQLPSLLGGVGPMHSFVQLFQGIKNLVWMPIEQYRKDGQIVRGLQKGATSFSTSTAMAILELTSRLINTIQSAAVVAYDMVSPGPSVSSQLQTHVNSWQRSSQPIDIREGVATAYNVLKEGLGDTAHSIVLVASKEHEHKGVRGAVGGVLRQIPPACVKPIIVGAEATCSVLKGVRNQLVPDAHREAVDKWRTNNK